MRLSVSARFVVVALAVAPASTAAQEPDAFGFWTPRDGSPITHAVADKIPVDGGECMGIAIAKTPVGLLGMLGADRDLGLPQHPEFVACMVERGWVQAPPADYKVRRLLGQAKDCTDGHGYGCAGVVNTYLHGVPGASVPLDVEAGLTMARKLCQGGDGDVCLTLASVFMHGAVDTGIRADVPEAVRWADVGCSHGHAASCGFAGVVLSTPDHPGLRPDAARGQAYLKEACKRGMNEACDWPRRPEDLLREANLPDGHRWCKYALSDMEGSGTCPDAPVGWLGLPTAQGCAKAVEVKLGNCKYRYALGR